jgi:hypothetical protein
MNISKLIQAVEAGEESPLTAYATLKAIADDAKDAMDHIKAYAISEAEKYGDKTFVVDGFEFTLNAGKRTYDFKTLPDWAEASKFIKELEARYKSAASAAEKGNKMLDDDTGEIIPAAVVKYSAPFLTIKRK